MRSNRIRNLLSASFLAAAALAAAPAAAQQPYDGLWQVTVVTKTGSCDAQTASTVTVADGKVTGSGAPVSGTVGSGGLVRSLDQWCICERSTQWQLRIGEMEWGISWRTVQRSMGSIPSVRLQPVKQSQDQNSSPKRGG